MTSIASYYISYSTKSIGGQPDLLRGPYRRQVRGPGGIPRHPQERELILPDSGERLLFRLVTTTLGPQC